MLAAAALLGDTALARPRPNRNAASLAAQPPALQVCATLFWCCPTCGDGCCHGSKGEDKQTCPLDCGEPPQEPGQCNNNGACEPEIGEANYNCPGDCPAFCGDGVCKPEEVDNCPGDCPVEVTCGDGICSALEDSDNCIVDCGNPTETPTPEPTATDTPAAAPTDTPEPTMTPTDTPEPTATDAGEPEESQEEETAPAAEATATPEEETTPEPDDAAECQVVSPDDLPDEVVTDTESGLPRRFLRPPDEPVVWVECGEGEAEVCLPGEALNPDGASGDLALLDCEGPDDCQQYDLVEGDGGQWCATIEDDQEPITCSQGCAVIERSASGAVQTAARVGIPLALLAGGVIVGFVVLSRRSREGQMAEETDE